MPDESGTVNEEISAWCEPKPDTKGAYFGCVAGNAGPIWQWDGYQWVPYRCYDRSCDACAEFERLVRERDKWRWYVHSLAAELGGWEELREEQHEDLIYMDFADATAPKRCAAMLRVIRETK